MPSMRIYRRQEHAGELVGLRLGPKFIPIEPANADYALYVLLTAQGKALTLNVGEALPPDVEEDAKLLPTPAFLPKKD